MQTNYLMSCKVDFKTISSEDLVKHEKRYHQEIILMISLMILILAAGIFMMIRNDGFSPMLGMIACFIPLIDSSEKKLKKVRKEQKRRAS